MVRAEIRERRAEERLLRILFLSLQYWAYILTSLVRQICFYFSPRLIDILAIGKVESIGKEVAIDFSE